MQEIDQLKGKPVDTGSLIGLGLLVPSVLWWAALVLSFTISGRIAEYLGNGAFQVAVLVVAPMLAAATAFLTLKKRKDHMRVIIITAGIVLAGAAFLASFRSS
jgi:hypothetical protein